MKNRNKEERCKMANNNQIITIDKIPVFRMDGGELYRLARYHYRLGLNSLSPFIGQPEEGEQLSAEVLALASDPDLKRIANVLAAPELRVSFCVGGMGRPPESFRLYSRRDGEKTAVVYVGSSNNLVETIYFEDLNACCSYLATLYAAHVAKPSPNLIKPEVSLEVMLIILAFIDCYRRAYLNEMLSSNAKSVEAIYEEEFLTVFDHELKSPDIRWLLPAFLRLVPDLGKTSLVFSGQHMEMVRALGFYTRAVEGKSNKAVYLFGPTLKYLGLEFSIFWNTAIGFEVSVLKRLSGKVESVGRYFLAPTDEANHFISIERRGDNYICTHQSLNFDGTVMELERLLQEHLKQI